MKFLRPFVKEFTLRNTREVHTFFLIPFFIVLDVSITDSKKPELSFSSQGQYLLINEASVEWIMEKLDKNSDCSRDTILYRFRGNMVLRGSIPFQETTWRRIQIGEHTFEVCINGVNGINGK